MPTSKELDAVWGKVNLQLQKGVKPISLSPDEALIAKEAIEMALNAVIAREFNERHEA